MAECTHDCSACAGNCDARDKQSLIKPLHEGASVKKVIAVASGKGGVGKSLVTSLLAVRAAARGNRVAVLDADITGPSIPKAFGVSARAFGDEGVIYPVRTKSGMLLRATGDKQDFVTSLGRDQGSMKILGLAIGNGCTALSGSILAQQAESASVSIGTGMVVQALAAVIIGTSVFGRIKRLQSTTAVLLGTILYKAVLLVAMLWLPSTFLKLTMAILFVAALLTDRIGKKKGGAVHG